MTRKDLLMLGATILTILVTLLGVMVPLHLHLSKNLQTGLSGVRGEIQAGLLEVRNDIRRLDLDVRDLGNRVTAIEVVLNAYLSALSTNED